MGLYLNVRHHGGKCCGIKTIDCFPCKPNSSLDEQNASSKYYNSNDHCYPGQLFWNGKAPAENAKQRLIRALNFIKLQRPGGIVEVVLTDLQKKTWDKTLVELGFQQLVPVTQNSNSYNFLYMYHLCLKKGEPVLPEKKKGK